MVHDCREFGLVGFLKQVTKGAWMTFKVVFGWAANSPDAIFRLQKRRDNLYFNVDIGRGRKNERRTKNTRLFHAISGRSATS